MHVHEFVKKVKQGEFDPVENIQKVLDRCKTIDSEYHYFNRFSEDLAKEQANSHQKGRLAGLPVSVKDCICVKGIESRAGSKILNGYKPVFNATAVQKVIDEGALIIGKTAQDEFGFGSFSSNVGIGFNRPLNPIDKERACGGSSGGSAGLAGKADFPHISLAESTGGSIAAPASFCGVVGLCPTYGRVSRYGLIDYANSLDKIGPIGKSVYDCALALEIISGHDKNESTTLDAPVDRYSKFLGEGADQTKKQKIAVIKECFSEGVDDAVSDKVWQGIKKLESEGIPYEEISLPLADNYSIPSYYLIAMAESSTNLAKYCGMRYGAHPKVEGSFNEYFSKVRSENFGSEAKRRIIIGTFARMAGYRDAFYMKSLRLRTKIIAEYKKAFKSYSALVSPTMPILPPRFSEIEKLTPLQNYMMDAMTAGPNLSGLPHISIPCKTHKGLPIGMMLVCDHLDEKSLIQIGGMLEGTG